MACRSKIDAGVMANMCHVKIILEHFTWEFGFFICLVMQDRRSRWPADRGGVYVHFVLHKENLDTQETVNYLAGKLG